MFSKNKYLFILFLLFFGVSNIYCLDFDEVVDFSVNLKELNLSIENGQEDRLDKNKYYILNGIFSNISPRILTRSYFFYINKEDLISQASFIGLIKSGNSPLALYIKNSLSDDTKNILNNTSVSQDELTGAVLKDLAGLMKSGIIYSPDAFLGISIDDDLVEILNVNPAAQEEIVFLNRLLLETAFPGQIKPVTLEMEIIYSEWIGTEDVIGYKCYVNLSGPLAFRVFNRLRPEDGCSLMLPVNSKVMIVAKPVKVISKEGESVWLMETYYMREI